MSEFQLTCLEKNRYGNYRYIKSSIKQELHRLRIPKWGLGCELIRIYTYGPLSPEEQKDIADRIGVPMKYLQFATTDPDARVEFD